MNIHWKERSMFVCILISQVGEKEEILTKPKIFLIINSTTVYPICNCKYEKYIVSPQAKGITYLSYVWKNRNKNFTLYIST